MQLPESASYIKIIKTTEVVTGRIGGTKPSMNLQINLAVCPAWPQAPAPKNTPRNPLTNRLAFWPVVRAVWHGGEAAVVSGPES